MTNTQEELHKKLKYINEVLEFSRRNPHDALWYETYSILKLLVESQIKSNDNKTVDTQEESI